MLTVRSAGLALLFLLVAGAATAQSRDPVSYRVTFPAPEHHWLRVEATFPALAAGPFTAQMSRSSPGRYATHEFAKNIFRIEARDGGGRSLPVVRSGADSWTVGAHDGAVTFTYDVFGDHADGTYLGVDMTHAHMNMPAVFLWSAGLEMRPITIAFVPPTNSAWKVGTQLLPTTSPFAFTAPNLQYFMDSPTELSDFLVATFQVPGADGRTSRFRLVVHADAAQNDVDALAQLVERLVREERAVFGEFPVFEPGAYTFLLDYVPWAYGDGMEHRNSTLITTPGLSIKTDAGRRAALSTISHEFFHTWNVERIRPVGLEPFDFSRPNVTCCLWLAEGFTEYYGQLLALRAGLSRQVPIGAVDPVVNGPGRRIRSAVQMSELATFADASVANDMDDRDRTFISYYTYGEALALALDLSLRQQSAGAVTLDDYMRELWRTFGAPVDDRPGFVRTPYSLRDARDVLARVAKDARFADEFFDRYVEGRDVPDYARLLAPAGFVVRLARPGAGWVGDVSVVGGPEGVSIGNDGTGSRSLVPFDTPLYAAGLDEGDLVISIDGRSATTAAWSDIARRKPGDSLSLVVRRRDGRTSTVQLAVAADPALQVVSVESAGGTLTAAQRAFRAAWLDTRIQ